MTDDILYYVDIPRYDSDEGSWINLTVCATRGEAEQYLFDRYGIKHEHCDCFITMGQRSNLPR